MWVERKIEIDVECNDGDPEAQAIKDVNFNEDEMLQDRTEIVLSDNQYTDQQELQDRERDHERK